jgi:hypothetical protein
MTILDTPFLGLGHDEQLNDYEPTKKDELIGQKTKETTEGKPRRIY